MKESEVWEEIQHIEQAMKEMHESIDRIIEGCSNEDAAPIRVAALMLRNRMTHAFEIKFVLIHTIRQYFHAS